jgi:hypothetical protein
MLVAMVLGMAAGTAQEEISVVLASRPTKMSGQPLATPPTARMAGSCTRWVPN